MSDLIITKQATINILKRVRSPKIVIKNPENGNKTITFQVAEATYENDVLSNEKVINSISKELDETSMVEDITFIDPITQQEVTLKVATVAKAIEQFFIDLYNK
jgi:hypothetical protein